MRDEALASYQFGPFRFVVRERALFQGDAPISLSPKEFDTLRILLRENGRLVTKDQIIGEVWPDSFVGDGSLSRNISVLRKVLGDGYIETVPKSGYRFAGHVTCSIDSPSERQSTPTVRAMNLNADFDASLPLGSHSQSQLAPSVIWNNVSPASTAERVRELRYQNATELRTESRRPELDNKTGSHREEAIPRWTSRHVPWWRSKLALGMGALILICVILGPSFTRWGRGRRTDVSVRQPTHQAVTFLGTAFTPAISPDGSFVSYVTSPPESNQTLILWDLASGHSLDLFEAPSIENPRWSPDGSELMIRARQRDPEKTGLYVVSRLGGPARSLGVDLRRFCWLPDGSHLVAGNTNPESGIWLVDKQTGQRKQLHAPAYQWLLSLDSSAKTGMLLLLTKTSDKYQLWTMKPDGSEQHQVIEGQKEIGSPRWSAIGDSIYYFRKQGDTTDLMKYSTNGQSTEPVVLVSGLETGDNFTISADGSQLAYTRTQSYSNLWLAELSSPGATTKVHESPLTSGTLSYNDPSISPDGRWVTFAITAGAKSNIYKMAINGGQPIQLTFFNAAESVSPGWSPDGRRIAFICNQGGTSKVWVVNADGGTAHPFDKTNASDTNNRLAWFPSPDVVYQSPGLHNLLRMNAETEEEEPVFRTDSEGWLISRPKFSPDGKKFAIFWNRDPSQGLWIATPETKSERLLSPKAYWALGWSPDGNFVYAGESGGREIVRIAINSSKETTTLITVHGLLDAGSVSPDGREVIFNATEEKSDVWLMRNFDPQSDRGKQPRD
jgi:Tol biopolymer transport system component/DNA-binding winged helix-turn-helix (wHTH) protein